MIFYLGVHRPNWLGTLDVPLFVSHRTLMNRRTFPRAAAPWALDSGGFTELSTFGEWRTTPEQYVTHAQRYFDEVGPFDFMAPQDWMCEPWITDKTGLTIDEHQKRTVANYLELRSLTDLPVVPVVQGWERDHYLRCVDLYEAAGVNLGELDTVGLGTVCRRQDTTTAEDIVLALRPLRIHGFGMKVTGLRRYGYLLASADSMAWSFGGRMRKPDLHTDCALKSCANCSAYALVWREKVLGSLDYQQTHLEAS
jgi:hypothetical protein